jgi:hypothetical protein
MSREVRGGAWRTWKTATRGAILKKCGVWCREDGLVSLCGDAMLMRQTFVRTHAVMIMVTAGTRIKNSHVCSSAESRVTSMVWKAFDGWLGSHVHFLWSWSITPLVGKQHN